MTLFIVDIFIYPPSFCSIDDVHLVGNSRRLILTCSDCSVILSLPAGKSEKLQQNQMASYKLKCLGTCGQIPNHSKLSSLQHSRKTIFYKGKDSVFLMQKPPPHAGLMTLTEVVLFPLRWRRPHYMGHWPCPLMAVGLHGTLTPLGISLGAAVPLLTPFPVMIFLFHST